MIMRSPSYNLTKYARRSPVTSLFFLFISLVIAFFVGKEEIKEYHHDLLIRDSGVKGYGIVIAHSAGRSSDLDYKYTYYAKTGGPGSVIISRWHEISRETYRKYPIGSRIPIKTNPKDPKDTHLDVQGYWSNARLMVSGSLSFVIYSLILSMPCLMIWYIIVAMRNPDIGFGPTSMTDAKTAAANAFFNQEPL